MSTATVYECGNDCGYEETERDAADRSYAEDCPDCGGPMMAAG